MEIELINGKKVELSMNPIVTEYLSDYDGGIEQMSEDISGSRNLMSVANHIAYSVISANINEKLSFNELMRLLKLEDVEKILDFVIENTSNFSDKTNQTNKSISTIKKY